MANSTRERNWTASKWLAKDDSCFGSTKDFVFLNTQRTKRTNKNEATEGNNMTTYFPISMCTQSNRLVIHGIF